MAKTIDKIILGLFVIVMLNLGTFLVAGVVSDKNPLDSIFLKPKISEQQAVSIASSMFAGPISDVELEKLNGVLVYAVEIEEGSSEIDVKIDANSGQVLKIEREDELGVSELEVINARLTEQQAMQVALIAVPGTVTELEAEKVNGRYVYEVEINSNGEEFDVSVDVVTGEVVSIEQEIEEQYEEDLSSTPSAITESQAKQIALEEMGGGRVTDIERDRENGKMVYEVEIQYGGKEYDVLVEIETGRIAGIEND